MLQSPSALSPEHTLGPFPHAADPRYPYINCTHPSRAAECKLMDTDNNGQINMWDDMFSPYYPGDDVVDWVGMSVFHFGQVGSNPVPAVGWPPAADVSMR